MLRTEYRMLLNYCLSKIIDQEFIFYMFRLDFFLLF